MAGEKKLIKVFNTRLVAAVALALALALALAV